METETVMEVVYELTDFNPLGVNEKKHKLFYLTQKEV